MKKFLLLTLLLISGLVQASELVVIDEPLRLSRLEKAQSEYIWDLERQSASIKLVISALSFNGSTVEMAPYKTIIREVPELQILGSELVALTPDGNVVCGTLGTTRVLKRSVLRLSGKCDLITRVIREGEIGRVKVLISTENK